MKDLASHIQFISSAQSIDEAFAYFCTVMARNGYDKVVYSLLTDHHSLGLEKYHGLASSYPEDWIKFYNEQNYLDHDPVVTRVFQGATPFFWDELGQRESMSNIAQSIIQQGSDAGLNDGIGIPLIGKAGEVVGIGLARTDKDKEKDYHFLADAYLLSTHFHQKFRTLYLQDTAHQLPNLSEREKDVLSWAAEGKNNDDIAVILGISVDTVKTYLKGCYRKLGVNNRAYAITKAQLLGLITPNNIISSPHSNG